MKSRNWLSYSLVLVLLMIVAGCRQEATEATPTPPETVEVIPVPSTASDSAPTGYPAPVEDVGAAYPGPDTDGQPTPEVPAGDSATPEPGPVVVTPPVDTSQPEQPAPVVPIITVSAVVVEPLPEAGVFAPPEGESSIALGSTVQHTVIKGDWLLQVARCYGTTYEAVRDANYLPFPDYLVPGSSLSVPNVGSDGPVIGPPCVVEYTVQPNDTWEGLASDYGTTVAVLQRANPGPLTVGRVILVPSTEPASVALPPLTHHLIFNFGGNLAIWRNTDGLVELTIDTPTILDLAANGTGQYVLVRQTRDEGLTNEIALIDTVARTSVVVEADIPAQPDDYPGSPVSRLHISPDGTWAVYAVETDSTYRLTSFQTLAPGTRYSVSDIPYDAAASLFGVSLYNGATGTSFVVSDATGLDEYPYSLDRSPRSIIALGGISQTLPNQFFNITTVPGGEYLLALGAFFEGAAYFTIDAQTGAIGMVPGSGGYVTSGATFATTDGRIVVVTPTVAGSLGPLWTTYEPQTAGTEVTFNSVSSEVTPILTQPATQESMPGYIIDAPSVQDSALPYTIAIIGSPTESGLWRTGAPGANLAKLNTMPDGPMMQTWVPDASGTLATVFDNALGDSQAIYVSAAGDPFLSLSAWLGGPISDPYWVRQ